MDWDIQRIESCDSTMDEAGRLAANGAPEGTLVIAQRMDEGRGTHGRPWHAPEGGLYLSFILRRQADPRFLTLAIGNAVADVLEVAGAEPRLKWVNDVLVDGRKMAGILVEASSTGSEIDHIVCGIGINLNGHAADWPHPLHEQAITLQDVLGAENCIEDVETLLLQSLGEWIDRAEHDPEHVIATWRDRDALTGREVGFDPDGDLCAKLIGTAAGIDDEGRILIHVDGQLQAFRTGTVFPHD